MFVHGHKYGEIGQNNTELLYACFLLPPPHQLLFSYSSIVTFSIPVCCFHSIPGSQWLVLFPFHSRVSVVGTVSIPFQGLNGWYQLLDEQKGKNENMQVPTSLSKNESTSFGFQRPGQMIFAVSISLFIPILYGNVTLSLHSVLCYSNTATHILSHNTFNTGGSA